jgi:hypothetical protein
MRARSRDHRASSFHTTPLLRVTRFLAMHGSSQAIVECYLHCVRSVPEKPVPLQFTTIDGWML